MKTWRLVPSCGDVPGTGGTGSLRDVDGDDRERSWDIPWQSYWAKCAMDERGILVAVVMSKGFGADAVVVTVVVAADIDYD